jgi:hypothetical protein
MNNNKVPVEPQEIQQPAKIVSYYNYNVMDFIPFQSIRLNCILFTANNEYIESKIVTMAGEAYANWGNNDEYLIDYMNQQLGLTPLPPNT